MTTCSGWSCGRLCLDLVSMPEKALPTLLRREGNNIARARLFSVGWCWLLRLSERLGRCFVMGARGGGAPAESGADAAYATGGEGRSVCNRHLFGMHNFQSCFDVTHWILSWGARNLRSLRSKCVWCSSFYSILFWFFFFSFRSSSITWESSSLFGLVKFW